MVDVGVASRGDVPGSGWGDLHGQVELLCTDDDDKTEREGGKGQFERKTLKTG